MPHKPTYKRPDPRDMGLQPYIDEYWQRLHPGAASYGKFVDMLENGATKAYMRDKLKVGSPNTITSWIKIYREQHDATK